MEISKQDLHTYKHETKIGFHNFVTFQSRFEQENAKLLEEAKKEQERIKLSKQNEVKKVSTWKPKKKVKHTQFSRKEKRAYFEQKEAERAYIAQFGA